MNGPAPAEWRQWRRRVLGADMTAAQKNVMFALETFADYPAGTNARPGITTLAAMCGLKERVVRYALERGVELDFIEQTAPANPKRRLADVYRLVFSGTSVPVETVSSGTSVPVETGFQVARNGFQVARNDVSSGTSVPPTKSDQVNTPGELRKPGTAPGEPAPDPNDPSPNPSSNGKPANGEPNDVPPPPDVLPLPPNHWLPDYPEPEPPQYCTRHPNGTTERCPTCGDARKKHDAWTVRRGDWRRAKHDARLAWRAACDECDTEGWLLGTDGTPLNEPAAALCPHSHIWGAYWRRRGVFPIAAGNDARQGVSGRQRGDRAAKAAPCD